MALRGTCGSSRKLHGSAVLALLLCVALWLPPHALAATQTEQPFDVVIVHGHIIDGTGSPWYSGDIGIRAGHIVAIGALQSHARHKTIDAAGDVVAPGFIDMLGQSELSILVEPRLPSKIYQGITTEITGEGGSVAPLNDAIIQSGNLPALRREARLAHVARILCAPGKAGHRH
jgi:N-acyl-D-amino-acid deacylase